MKKELDPKKFDLLLKKHLSEAAAHEDNLSECPDENMVSAYLESTLPRKLKEDMERHTAHCSRCQQEMALILKSTVSSRATNPALTSASDNSRANWLLSLTHFLRWFGDWDLKPALAILVVTLIAGYMSYELVNRQEAEKWRSTEMTEPRDSEAPIKQATDRLASTSPEKKETDQAKDRFREEDQQRKAMSSRTALEHITPPSADAVAPSAPPAGTAGDPDRYALKEDRSESAIQENMATANSAGQAREMQRRNSQSFATPPSAPAPTESAESKPAPSLDEKKSSLPLTSAEAADTVGTTISTDQEKEAKNRIAPTAPQAIRAKSKSATQATSLAKSQTGQPSSEFQRESRQDRPETLPQAQSRNEMTLRDERNHQRLSVAGKVFELRNNVWTDLSIKENEKRNVIVIFKNSSSYQDEIKPLSAYQELLSLPEDCFIKHNGKVYQIKGSP